MLNFCHKFLRSLFKKYDFFKALEKVKRNASLQGKMKDSCSINQHLSRLAPAVLCWVLCPVQIHNDTGSNLGDNCPWNSLSTSAIKKRNVLNLSSLDFASTIQVFSVGQSCTDSDCSKEQRQHPFVKGCCMIGFIKVIPL